MARPKLRTVDYFSHDCKHTRTLRIVEARYKNDGYAVWFKLLETLGKSEEHTIDFSDELLLQDFSVVECHISAAETLEILDFLSRLGAIDQELWSHNRVVWCQHFVDRLEDVYRKRKTNLPEKPHIRNGNPISAPETLDTDSFRDGNTTKERKGKESKEDKEPPDTPPVPTDPPEKKNGQHYSSKMCREDFKAIDQECKRLIELKCVSKKFNPHQVVQILVNESIHPMAILQVLKELVKRWNTTKNPWGYVRSIIDKLNFRAQEEATIKEAKTVAGMWDEFAAAHPSILPAFDMPDARDPPLNEQERIRQLKDQAAALKGV